jgi:hypothetical protein
MCRHLPKIQLQPLQNENASSTTPCSYGLTDTAGNCDLNCGNLPDR